MALLAADIGNSHTVLGLIADGEVSAEWRIATDARRTADEWSVLLRGQGIELPFRHVFGSFLTLGALYLMHGLLTGSTRRPLVSRSTRRFRVGGPSLPVATRST